MLKKIGKAIWARICLFKLTAVLGDCGFRENWARRAWIKAQKKALKKQEKYIEARDDRMRILEQVHQRREELEADANQ